MGGANPDQGWVRRSCIKACGGVCTLGAQGEETQKAARYEDRTEGQDSGRRAPEILMSLSLALSLSLSPLPLSLSLSLTLTASDEPAGAIAWLTPPSVCECVCMNE